MSDISGGSDHLKSGDSSWKGQHEHNIRFSTLEAKWVIVELLEHMCCIRCCYQDGTIHMFSFVFMLLSRKAVRILPFAEVFVHPQAERKSVYDGIELDLNTRNEAIVAIDPRGVVDPWRP